MNFLLEANFIGALNFFRLNPHEQISTVYSYKTKIHKFIKIITICKVKSHNAEKPFPPPEHCSFLLFKHDEKTIQS